MNRAIKSSKQNDQPLTHEVKNKSKNKQQNNAPKLLTENYFKGFFSHQHKVFIK